MIDIESLKNPCAPKINMASKYGCPLYTSSPLTTFNKKLEIAIAVLMILLGGLLLWFGGRYPKLALEVLTTIIVGFVLI